MSNRVSDVAGYRFADRKLNSSHEYLLPALARILGGFNSGREPQRIFEVGCGNGSVANELTKKGFDVTGVDPSEEGIGLANKAFPALRLFRGSAYDDLAAEYGRFPIVISLEVVEHVYNPREFARTLYDLVEDRGVAIVSAPFHGFWKNLALALSGKFDDHFTALWDHGHIKFWSVKTLKALLEEAGFSRVAFTRVGRIPPLAKSMIAVATKA